MKVDSECSGISGRVFRVAVALLVSLPCLSVHLCAQTNNCDHRIVVVNVRDSEHEFAKGLVLADFQAELHGKPIKVLKANESQNPKRVAILLDLSGSIVRRRNISLFARQVAGDVISSGAHHTALMTFGSEVFGTFGFDTPDSDKLKQLEQIEQAAQRPSRETKTALMDALLAAATLFGSAQPGDAIYAVTDGGDNDSHHTIDDVSFALLSRGIRFFGFIVADRRLPSDDRYGPEDMRALARTTGGDVADLTYGSLPLFDSQSAKERSDYRNKVRNLDDLISHVYELEIEIPTSLTTKQSWRLKLVDSHGKRRKDLKLTYPSYQTACQKPGGLQP